MTVRTMDGGEPDIPIYKVIECTGPTNTRVYKVAVYFRGKRLASSTGHSIQQAEMEAAKKALENSSELFPQLDYQKRVMAHSMKRQKGNQYDGDRKRNRHNDLRSARRLKDDDSNLPKQYRAVRDESKTSHSDASNSGLDSNSDSESDSASDSNSSDSSISKCSTDQNEKFKQTKAHKHHKSHQHKCTHSSSVADDQRNTIVEESTTKMQTISNNDNEDSIAHREKVTEDSDTDISLESGEIP